jgi:hypothetical protein
VFFSYSESIQIENLGEPSLPAAIVLNLPQVNMHSLGCNLAMVTSFTGMGNRQVCEPKQVAKIELPALHAAAHTVYVADDRSQQGEHR